jgi:hypothetical protein
MTYDYWEICREFRRLTAQRSAESGMCCRKTVGGVPWCCATLVDGTERLQFTKAELGFIAGADESKHEMVLKQNGLLLKPSGRPKWPEVFIGKVWDAQLLTNSLRDGLLSAVLENVAHPTRPVLSANGSSVVSVGSVHDCVAEYAAHELRSNYILFRDLWRAAVELTGIKPYYPYRSLPGR